jgi:uncharacterized ion transporter superfamily protein YfcC
MSVLKALLIVLICVITSMVVTTAAVQDQAIDYRMIILPVKVSLNLSRNSFKTARIRGAD